MISSPVSGDTWYNCYYDTASSSDATAIRSGGWIEIVSDTPDNNGIFYTWTGSSNSDVTFTYDMSKLIKGGWFYGSKEKVDYFEGDEGLFEVG